MIVDNEFHGMTFCVDYSEYVFRLYDPLTSKSGDLSLPQPYQNKIFDLILRSRKILKKRNLEEIYFAVNALHEMNSIIIYGLPEDDSTPKYAPDYIVPYPEFMSVFNISQLDEFPDATWPEFFAISALICIGIILESFDREDPTFEQSIGLEDAVDWSYFAFETTLNAVEAITYAESLIDMHSTIDEEGKKKISLKNRNAINIRHSTKNAIKDEFVESYNSDSTSSKAESARRFYKKLTEDKKKHFRDEKCAVRSLLDHQRKLSKQ